jgi:hypothetical protein
MNRAAKYEIVIRICDYLTPVFGRLCRLRLAPEETDKLPFVRILLPREPNSTRARLLAFR